MKFTFNIIYTPGVVKCLRLFILSLLKWSDCSFRLVANGCLPEEVHDLRAFCRRYSRLEFLKLPSKTMMKHSSALNYLQMIEPSEYFCFMDPDILATNEFLHEFTPYLDHYVGVFSGFPIWCKNEEQILPETFPEMFGRHNMTSTGLCIGGTFFAIYNNKVLTELIQSTGISFNKYKWEEIPALYQKPLAQLGLKKNFYDTGKVLNLLLLNQGDSLIFKEIPSLKHIGGISACLALENGFHWHYLQQRKLKDNILAWLFEGKFRRTVMKLSRIKEPKVPRLEITDEVLQSHPNRNRLLSYRYFTQLLQCLLEESQPLPSIPDIGTPEVEEKIERLTTDIKNLFEEFKVQLLNT